MPDPLVVSLLEEFQATRLKSDWAAMGRLLHSEARLESLAALGSVLIGGELVQVVQRAMAHGLYTVTTWHVEALLPSAALADGRVRYQLPRGALTDEPRIWVATERDELIWRMRIFRTRDEALACYRRDGVDLGI
jgi:hypothetical protein